MGMKGRIVDKSGMTLLELMVASGVMVIALVLLFQCLISMSRLRALSEQRAIAMSHANTIMEEIGNLDYAGLLAYVPPTLGGLNGLAVEIRCHYDAENYVVVPVAALEDPLPNPVEVEVAISWRDIRGLLMHYSATTVHRR